MEVGNIIYCKNTLSKDDSFRPCILLSKSGCNLEIMWITKQSKKWDYEKVEIVKEDVCNFKAMPSFLVLNIFPVGCMDCRDSDFNSNATINLINKLKEHGFDV